MIRGTVLAVTASTVGAIQTKKSKDKDFDGSVSKGEGVDWGALDEMTQAQLEALAEDMGNSFVQKSKDKDFDGSVSKGEGVDWGALDEMTQAQLEALAEDMGDSFVQKNGVDGGYAHVLNNNVGNHFSGFVQKAGGDFWRKFDSSTPWSMVQVGDYGNDWSVFSK